MRRHWGAEHRASHFGSMSPAERKDAIDRLSGNLQKTSSFFRKQTAEADKIVRASYDADLPSLPEFPGVSRNRA